MKVHTHSLKSHNCAMQDAQLATDRSKAVVLCNSCFMLFDEGVSGRISYYIFGYLLAHLSRRLIGEALSIYRHPTSFRSSVHRPSVNISLVATAT